LRCGFGQIKAATGRCAVLFVIDANNDPFVLSRPKAVSKEGDTAKNRLRRPGLSFDTPAAQATQDERGLPVVDANNDPFVLSRPKAVSKAGGT
jgi:hypothetical protein